MGGHRQTGPFVPHNYDVFAGLDVDKTSIAATFAGHEGTIKSMYIRPSARPEAAAAWYDIRMIHLLLLAALPACAAQSVGPGLSYAHSNGYHVVVANLDSAQMEVGVARPRPKPAQNMLTVSQWAKSEGAYVAINANYFGGNLNFPCGAARGHGVQHPGIYAEPPNCGTTMGWARGRGAVFNSVGHEADAKFASKYTELATGGGLLLQNGQRRDWNHAKLEDRRGCTAIGLSADRKRFIFVVTDSRSCTGKGLQDVLLANGAADAIHLDGGGSSKMWIRGLGYVNNGREDRRPSVAIVARPRDGFAGCTGSDGLYCGKNGVPGDPNTLYVCAKGVLAEVRKCPKKCVAMPAGVNDRCDGQASCPAGDGLYCGGNGVAGDRGTLYRCSRGALINPMKCPKRCVSMPAGVNDRCE